MIVPRSELKIAFIVMYEEYKKAITAPRAETSVYFVAVGDGRWTCAYVDREQLTIITSGEGGLNVGSQRTIASGPAVGNGDVGRTSLPGPANVLLGNGTIVLESPNDVESQGISTEPWNLGRVESP